MDLLNENSKNKPKKTKGQKIILSLLIISIILCFVIAGILVLLKYKPVKKTYKIELNGKTIENNEIGLLKLEDESKMISIKAICNLLGFDYFNGEHNSTLEEKNKGYVNNGINIIQFYSNSNKIFKTKENEVTDYEYYKLKNKVIFYNDALYINIEDLNVALNLIQYYIEADNKTIISTSEYWIENNKDSLEKLGYTADSNMQNNRALSYGYVIVKANGKYGVISLSGKEIIGNKYNSIEFIEYTKQFIVSNNSNKFGVIDLNGATIINLQFDNIKIANFEPLLYQVKRVNEYGVLKEDGTIINEIKYSSIGYPEDKANNILYTLIVPEINSSIPKSIVVAQNNKYGLISIEEGKEVIPCVLKGIFLYVNVENNIKEYAVQYENGTYASLVNYVETQNKIVVNVNE